MLENALIYKSLNEFTVHEAPLKTRVLFEANSKSFPPRTLYHKIRIKRKVLTKKSPSLALYTERGAGERKLIHDPITPHPCLLRTTRVCVQVFCYYIIERLFNHPGFFRLQGARGGWSNFAIDFLRLAFFSAYRKQLRNGYAKQALVFLQIR